MQRVSGTLGNSVSRRRLLGLMAGAGVAAATGAFTASTAAAAGTAYRTTAAVNLRARPSIRATVLLVVPAGVKVIDYDGEIVAGYRSVDYNGTVGWIYDDYLELWSSTPPPPNPEFIGSAKTTTTVNLRSGPSTSNSVLRVVPAGTWVDIYDLVQNGYRYVVFDGVAGWIYDAYLGGGNEGAFITTANVNLRLRPSSSGRILVVVPKGATVVDYDGELSNGYRGVDYNGWVGWIFDDFLVKA